MNAHAVHLRRLVASTHDASFRAYIERRRADMENDIADVEPMEAPSIRTEHLGTLIPTLVVAMT